MRRFVLAIALALLPGRAPATTPAERLRAAERRYEAHLLTARPDLASRAGIARADQRLEPVTEASIPRDADTLAGIAAEAAAIERPALRERERAVLDTLRARLERELAPLRSGAWRTDPDLYLALAHAAPLEAAQRPCVGPCERARRAAARLRAVPEVLLSAEVNLGAAPLADRRAAAERWRSAMLDLRVTLPALFAECRDAERYASFVEADSVALGAMGRFARFLLEDVPAIAPSDANR